ncbi:MAG TPA: molybdate ABC transporter substrate-binding protein [Mycobacteriales bacterium]
MRRVLGTAAAVAVLALAAGCGDSTDPAAAPPGSGGGLSGTVTVFAAASLTEPFTTLGRQFEAAHPGVQVRFNFAASSALAQSIAQGAPADVFASASLKTMAQVTDAADPKTFATNVMEIAVPPDNPGNVTGVADLARPGLKVALCQAQVPCGATAQAVFDKQKLTVPAVTLGADVKSVLTQVQLGEVDAGVVYRTDVRAAGAKVRGIEIPADRNASTAYPIAALKDAPNPAGAAAFVDQVLSADGRTVLTAAGFAGP